MLFTIDVYKNLTDYIWGWGSLIGAIAVPILVWYFGSSRAEKKRKENEENEALNYLLTSAYRYFQYLQGLEMHVFDTKNKMQNFVDNPNEESKLEAFRLLTPPTINFDIKLNNYAFTIKNQPLVTDFLFHFMTILEELKTHINFLNSDMALAYRRDIPIDNFIFAAKGYLNLNLENFFKVIYMGIYILFRLMYETQDYQKYMNNPQIISFQWPAPI
jgi:hypothetical protein